MKLATPKRKNLFATETTKAAPNFECMNLRSLGKTKDHEKLDTHLKDEEDR